MRAPLVFAPEKDESFQIFFEYPKVSFVTLRDSYPSPRKDECIDSIGGTAVFQTLGANNVYLQIEVQNADGDKKLSFPPLAFIDSLVCLLTEAPLLEHGSAQ